MAGAVIENPSGYGPLSYRDPSVLEDLYFNEDLNQKEIAEYFDVSPATINKWVKKTDIPHSEYESDFSKTELINHLQELSDFLGRTPSLSDLKEYGEYSEPVYLRVFGSWNNSLKEARLEVNRGSNEKVRISDELLIGELKRLASDLGHTPTSTDMVEKGRYGKKVYMRRFGSWVESVVEADLDPFDVKGSSLLNIPLECHLEEVRRVSDEIGRPPNSQEIEEFGRTKRKIFYDRGFDSWYDVLEEAGLDSDEVISYEIPDDELLSELERLYEELGRRPKQIEMDRFGEYSSLTYYEHFGSWDSSLRMIEEDDFEVDDVTTSWSEYRPYYSTFEWRQKREEVLERDDYECQYSECGFGYDESVEEYGAGLHVHHIVPLRDIDDESEYHDIDNLVSLCPRCHPKVECGKYELQNKNSEMI